MYKAWTPLESYVNPIWLNPKYLMNSRRYLDLESEFVMCAERHGLYDTELILAELKSRMHTLECKLSIRIFFPHYPSKEEF